MGKSTALCFNFITCSGGDSVDRGAVHDAHSKDSSDRRGWSFRKRSARHRVLSNSVISEAPTCANKETADNTFNNFLVQSDTNAPEKTSVINGTEDKAELTSQLDSKLSEVIVSKGEENGYATDDESSIVTIQAAVRGLLAQQVLLKQKNIIKLQAAVRGYLVRRYSVGTLRCILAIIKIQSLVRADYAHKVSEGSSDYAKHGEISGKDKNDSTHLGKKEAKPSGIHAFVSTEKLLSNSFARKLMESTQRPINIKCEPSKSDTAWKWLERWTLVSSVRNEEPLISGSGAEMVKENIKHSDAKKPVPVPSDCYTKPIQDSSSGVVALAEPSKTDDSLISDNANNLDPHSFTSSSPLSSDSQLHCINQSSMFDTTESVPIEAKEADLVGEVEVKSHPMEEEINMQDGCVSNYFSTEKPETEAKKASRKASNPAFIAAQSKFEELSSAANAAKLSTLSVHDHEVESSSDKVSFATKQPFRSVESGVPDNTFSNASVIQIGGSECGTELSVSSTLDSPISSEAGLNDMEQETELSDKTSHCRDRETLEPQGSEMSVILETDEPCTNSSKIERDESINSATGEYLNSAMTAADLPQPEKKQETDLRDLQLVPEASHTINKSSPEASPRSHITLCESQTTPSSLVPVKPKKNKGEKTESTRKNKPVSADKKSLLNPNQDSASRSNSEQLQEHKTRKKRNSMGSEKADHKEHEPRDSSGVNSLPSYMQATESARAKATANGSPRSSPDVHDKDIYIKKRHSLPASNERQGSPGMQRPVSQAQQVVKGNETHSPQERKWRR